ncbi:hypothetical protein TL16_g11154 [Triparma laevis f. inornata]|uniref:RING-type domain-containing protein n=1 Tax=Triparma laevis f. inornata TaxID=1714386 RepID=A0A9W7ER26_9STRA|nr:hypothetical protein TL16_g11154 [Triparma laevis f. inornata]
MGAAGSALSSSGHDVSPFHDHFGGARGGAGPMWIGRATQSYRMVHPGVSCDGCGESPLVGVRHKCTACHNYDLCQSCHNNSSDHHDLTHSFTELQMLLTHMELQMVTLLIDQQQRSLQHALRASMEQRKNLMKPATEDVVKMLEKRILMPEERDDASGDNCCAVCLGEWSEPPEFENVVSPKKKPTSKKVDREEEEKDNKDEEGKVCEKEEGEDEDDSNLPPAPFPYEVMCMPCGHFFHEVCLINWLERQNTCPVCRHEVNAQDPFEAADDVDAEVSNEEGMTVTRSAPRFMVGDREEGTRMGGGRMHVIGRMTAGDSMNPGVEHRREPTLGNLVTSINSLMVEAQTARQRRELALEGAGGDYIQEN